MVHELIKLEAEYAAAAGSSSAVPVAIRDFDPNLVAKVGCGGGELEFGEAASNAGTHQSSEKAGSKDLAVLRLL